MQTLTSIESIMLMIAMQHSLLYLQRTVMLAKHVQLKALQYQLYIWLLASQLDLYLIQQIRLS